MPERDACAMTSLPHMLRLSSEKIPPSRLWTHIPHLGSGNSVHFSDGILAGQRP
jgi:hypothetical protein